MGNYILDRIGEERLVNAYVWRTFLDGGVDLVLGTDWPTATFDPLAQLADTLFRVDVVPGNGVDAFDEGMTLTFEEALYAYTQAGADVTPWGAGAWQHQRRQVGRLRAARRAGAGSTLRWVQGPDRGGHLPGRRGGIRSEPVTGLRLSGSLRRLRPPPLPRRAPGPGRG